MTFPAKCFFPSRPWNHIVTHKKTFSDNKISLQYLTLCATHKKTTDFNFCIDFYQNRRMWQICYQICHFSSLINSSPNKKRTWTSVASGDSRVDPHFSFSVFVEFFSLLLSFRCFQGRFFHFSLLMIQLRALSNMSVCLK